jgi:hypothetical protein
VYPLDVLRGDHRFIEGRKEVLVEVNVAIREGAIYAVAIGPCEPLTLLLGQRDERNGLASAFADGLQCFAEAGDELLGNQYGGHGNLSVSVNKCARDCRPMRQRC